MCLRLLVFNDFIIVVRILELVFCIRVKVLFCKV